MNYILETQKLSKKYGRLFAANQIDMHIEKGQIYGLVGRNGAGKTTILKMLGGLATPSSGSFTVFGEDLQNSSKVRGRIGCLIENPGLFPELTAKQNLKLKCLAIGVNDKDTVDELLDVVGLYDAKDKKAGKFSLGMKQRLGIALALVGNPDIVILDEPINGLDPQGIAEVRGTIEKLNEEKGITFIISSHLLDELSKIANKYGIIQDGKLIEEFTTEELEQICSKRVELKVDDVKTASIVLESMEIKDFKVITNNEIHIYEALDRTGDITYTLAKSEVKTIEIMIKNETLEDFYLNMTGGYQNV